MAVLEKDGLWQYIDESGNIYILYPVTKLDNVSGTGALVKLVDGKLETIGGSEVLTPVASGGTGLNKLTAGSYLVGNGTNGVILKTPAEVAAELGAGNAKITFGSYVGTGTYGVNNPNSLTFDFAPKIVWIYAVFGPVNALKTPSGSYVSNILPMDFIPTEYTENLGLHLGSYGNESWGKKSADGKTLSWYSADKTYGVDAQGNTTGYRYFYMAMA